MARPSKVELDYFPLDCRLNDKMKLIEAEFGLDGFAVIIKLFQKIYGGKGYYCEINEEVVLLFAREINAGGNIVSEVIEGAIRRGIFDANMRNKYGILTSERIQETYFEAVARRDCVAVENKYLLISHTLLPKNVVINGVNVDRNPINVNDNPQKKRKEKKRNEMKLNEMKREENTNLPSPSIDDVMECCCRNGFIYVDPIRFYNFISERKLPLKVDMLEKWDREDRERVISQRGGFLTPQDVIIMMQAKGFTENDATYAMIEARKREMKEKRNGQIS